MVKLACERPDVVGRSLSPWDSAELARQLVRDGVVAAISPQTVQRILAHHQLKPWRHHLWRSPQVPRDAAFAAQGQEIVALYTRPLGVWERGLCVAEKTSLPPRPRKAPTLAAQPGQPMRVEHAYPRKGALNLFAGFDTRTGTVYATPAERKRQGEFIAFLEPGDRERAPDITRMHISGLDHGIGRFRPLRFILRLSVADSEALAAARQLAKSRQTSNAVSAQKTAAPLSSRLPV